MKTINLDNNLVSIFKNDESLSGYIILENMGISGDIESFMFINNYLINGIIRIYRTQISSSDPVSQLKYNTYTLNKSKIRELKINSVLGGD